MTKVQLKVTEPNGHQVKATYRTGYTEAAIQDAVAAVYRAYGVTEFAYVGEPTQEDVDYLQSRLPVVTAWAGDDE